MFGSLASIIVTSRNHFASVFTIHYTFTSKKVLNIASDFYLNPDYCFLEESTQVVLGLSIIYGNYNLYISVWFLIFLSIYLILIYYGVKSLDSFDYIFFGFVKFGKWILFLL